MCFGGGGKSQPETPAAPPAPPLEPTKAPEIGDARRKESKDLYGRDAPNYRVNRRKGGSPVNPDNPVTM